MAEEKSIPARLTDANAGIAEVALYSWRRSAIKPTGESQKRRGNPTCYPQVN
jgi:hypothetical protein